MKAYNVLRNLDVKEIYPHPDNPRKNLGDLEEMINSIEKNGVMQNLTVIPGHKVNGEWNTEGYTLIIGHRRCAAAKEAGLSQVPCRIIKDMTEKEQVSVMLEENMQRHDLTIWEQSQGFQMMLDLGETEDSIAEKTGFTKQTIKHRLNLAKLDQDELKAKEDDEGFQLTLKALYELEKIKDVEKRNEILRDAHDERGLLREISNVVTEERRKINADKIIYLLEDIGIKAAPKEIAEEWYTNKWSEIESYDLDEKSPKVVEFPDEEGDLFYYRRWGYLKVIRREKTKKKKLTPSEIKEKEDRKKKKQIREFVIGMDKGRKEFIKNMISGRIKPLKDENLIIEEIWKVLLEYSVYYSKSPVISFINEKDWYQCSEEEVEKALESKVVHQMFIILNTAMGTEGHRLVEWDGTINKSVSENLLKAYEIFKKYGWTFDENELEILNGEHDLYNK